MTSCVRVQSDRGRGEFLEHIELGSDAAATNSRARTAEASIAGLKILLYPVSHREVIQRYKSEEDTRSLYTKKWGWLDQREITPSRLSRTNFK